LYFLSFQRDDWKTWVHTTNTHTHKPETLSDEVDKWIFLCCFDVWVVCLCSSHHFPLINENWSAIGLAWVGLDFYYYVFFGWEIHICWKWIN
jgi:hypothetical protein